MHVLLPSETQIREFDPKLLLACCLAERGVASIVGSRIEMHSIIEQLPRGLYLSKDVRHSSARMFDILLRLGYRIAALDEEGLITLPPIGYRAQRVTESVLAQAELFFAWGEVHRRAILEAPGNRSQVLATGNPRFDLLRPELRGFYQAEAEALRARYGRFILINSNFGRANPAVKPRPRAGDPSPLGEGERLIDAYFGFRDRLFPHFAEIVPRLAAAMPQLRIVLRPHPAENFETWRKLCGDNANVDVVHEGYIAPWLLAAQTVLHNGCTTGVEAAMLGRPCISYRPLCEEATEITLPNDVSRQVFTFDELVGAVREVLDTGTAGSSGEAAQAIMQPHIAALDGALASERIADAITTELGQAPALPGLSSRLRAGGQATLRRWEKRMKSLIPGHKNSRSYSRQRFPGVSLVEAREKIARLQACLGRFDRVGIRPIADHLYEVRAGS